MFLTKSRIISIYKERKNRKKVKKYFMPTSFNSQKKSSENCSSIIKNEDFI